MEIPKTYNCVETFLDNHLKEGRENRVAVYFNDSTYTYGEVFENSNRVGNFLKDLGVERENRVLLLLPDSPELVFSFFGAMKIAAVPIPVNTRLTPSLYRYILNDSRAKVLIVHESLIQRIEEIEEGLRFLKQKIVVGQTRDGYLSFHGLLDSSSPELSSEETDRDDMAFWLYTSGSTGEPKGVVHLHRDLVYCCHTYAREILKISPEDICLSVSKMFHAYGLGNSLAFPFKVGASTVLFPDVPKPDPMLATAERFNATLFFGVPTFYAACTAIPGIEKRYPLSSVRLCVSAGEALSPITYDKWLEKFNLEIIDGIGSTEVLHIYLSNRPGKVRPGSLGLEVPGYEIRIVDEDRTIRKEGETGTLWVKGDSTTPFFWNNREKTKKQCKGEWFNTEDLFYKDRDGYYWYAGRSDDAFKSRGEWVMPVEIENVISIHPAVLESAVVGGKDRDGTDRPVAFVSLKPGYMPSEELKEEIRGLVKKNLPGYKVPQWVNFVEELPKTATGKIQRYKLAGPNM